MRRTPRACAKCDSFMAAGIGVQRGIVQRTLEQHALVQSFSDDARSHLGATIAFLKR